MTIAKYAAVMLVGILLTLAPSAFAQDGAHTHAPNAAVAENAQRIDELESRVQALEALSHEHQAEPVPTPEPEPEPEPEPSPGLLQPSDLSYAGYFDIPTGHWQDPKSERWDYSSGAIAYHDGALYVTTHVHAPNNAGLFAIPDSLPGTATLIQKGITLPRLGTDSRMTTRGLLYVGGSLHYTQYDRYNVAGDDHPDVGREDGASWDVCPNNLCAGPMARYQGKLLIGLTGAAGAASSNQGPSAYEVDTASGLPAVTLLEHDIDHRETMSNGEPWHTSMPSWGRAVVGDTLVVSVEEGERVFYGTGDEFKAEYGFSPRSKSKGYHHDRYRAMLYFYDMADLERVRAGELQPWEPDPYARMPLADVPVQAVLGGLAHDPSGQRLLLAQRRGSGGVRVYVYAIN